MAQTLLIISLIVIGYALYLIYEPLGILFAGVLMLFVALEIFKLKEKGNASKGS